MKTDRELQEQILAALEWEPGVDAAGIGVSVNDGVVTLQGTVPTFIQRSTAERTARHLFGVRAVANDIQVTPTVATSRTDAAIAQAAANALEWDAAVPDNAIKPTVSNGWVTLNGTVQWQFQMSAAVRAVEHLLGVKGVTNAIILKPQVSASDVKTKIENAFKRSAEIDAQRVKVETKDGGVILTGTVHTLVEKDEAERAAWAAPGVTRVDDRLMVAP